MAGFVDGEGTIGIIKARRPGNTVGYRLQPYLVVPNTNVEVLEAIRVMCGNGRLVEQTKPLKPHHKPLYSIRFMPNQIRHVLPQLRPYLIVKARQADYLMEFLRVNIGGRNVNAEQQAQMDGLRDAVCALNARGVKVSEAIN